MEPYLDPATAEFTPVLHSPPSDNRWWETPVTPAVVEAPTAPEPRPKSARALLQTFLSSLRPASPPEPLH